MAEEELEEGLGQTDQMDEEVRSGGGSLIPMLSCLQSGNVMMRIGG